MLNKEEQIDEFWKTKESLCFEDFEDFLADQDRISRESERQKIKKLLLEKGNGGGNWRRIIISIIK